MRVKAIQITHGAGAPTRQEVEVDPRVIEGLYCKRSDGQLIAHAYLYAPEHADEAFALITRQYQEDQAMRAKHTKEWNQLSVWRIKV